MTNSAQTVPVPLDLLNRLFDNTALTRDVFAGDSVDVRPSGIGALIDIKALIPTPPKVGDVLTADQIKVLPDAAVMRDEDGDVLVKVGQTVRRVTVDRTTFDRADWTGSGDINELRSVCHPITLVSLPTPRD